MMQIALSGPGFSAEFVIATRAVNTGLGMSAHLTYTNIEQVVIALLITL